MVQQNLLVDQFFELICVKTVQFKVEIEGTNKFCTRFVFFEVQSFEVWMPKRIFHTNTFLWIKCEHFTDEVNCFRVGTLENLVESGLLLCWQLSHKVSVLFKSNLVNKVLFWHADQVRNQLNLLLF